jgi:hypothetical protein
VSVIPIWTVDKNLAESNASASARCEPATSASASGAQARWPGGHNGQLGHRKQAIEHDQTRDDP